MPDASLSSATALPPRLSGWKACHLLVAAVCAAVTLFALWETELLDLSPGDVYALPGNVIRLVRDMIPPSTAILPQALLGMLETLKMALVGTVAGIALSLPLGILAARNTTPHRLCYSVARGLIGLARTVPDLVWAILFVIIVGLGPLAGTLTLLVDTVGFAGRFFAEAMEESEPGPGEALCALGARRSGIWFATIMPAALPSFINTGLFSLERAIQSSVVLGLVGAGGIGTLLVEPMTWHDYDQAATLIICIFILLAAVERFSSRYRASILG